MQLSVTIRSCYLPPCPGRSDSPSWLAVAGYCYCVRLTNSVTQTQHCLYSYKFSHQLSCTGGLCLVLDSKSPTTLGLNNAASKGRLRLLHRDSTVQSWRLYRNRKNGRSCIPRGGGHQMRTFPEIDNLVRRVGLMDSHGRWNIRQAPISD